jgi:type II secretory pathway component GspD/PulD (secretin)
VSANQIAETLKAIFNPKDLTIAVGPSPLTPSIQSSDSAKATGTEQTVLTKDYAGATTGSGGGGGLPTSRILVLYGPPAIVEQAADAARQLDKPRPQVSIDVRITDVENDALHDVGLNWDFSNLTLTETPSGVKFGTVTRSPMTFDATVKALESQNKAKLLAAPNLSILDGERGFVLIGDKLSYPVVSGYSQSGSPIISKEEKDVGIYLQVAANVGDDGQITLSLYPQVSTVTGYLTLNGASYPQISTREAQTTLRVPSGQTIVMGGLIKDEDIAAYETVPFLSKIPFLGELFKHRNQSKTKNQVIISITPVIIKPEPHESR